MEITIKHIPFIPANSDGLKTFDGKDFYSKHYDSTPEVFTLFKNTAENNRVDKTQYLTEVGTIEGVFRDEASVTNFAITIEYPRFIDFNYVYVPAFNRYYYVTDVTVVRTGLYEISLSIDVLMSYKDNLLNCTAFIDRNENYNSPYSIDTERVIRQGSIIESAYRLTQSAGYPNIILHNYEDAEAGILALQSEFCLILNGYNISAEDIVNE